MSTPCLAWTSAHQPTTAHSLQLCATCERNMHVYRRQDGGGACCARSNHCIIKHPTQDCIMPAAAYARIVDPSLAVWHLVHPACPHHKAQSTGGCNHADGDARARHPAVAQHAQHSLDIPRHHPCTSAAPCRRKGTRRAAHCTLTCCSATKGYIVPTSHTGAVSAGGAHCLLRTTGSCFQCGAAGCAHHARAWCCPGCGAHSPSSAI